jgi:cytochrome c oxidase subunit 2
VIRRLTRALPIGLMLATVALSACAPPPAPAPKDAASAAQGGGAAVTGDGNTGKTLFQQKGCIACHVAQGVPGATGTIGPNLNGIGDVAKRPKLADGANNTPEHVREWIKDPQKLKPGTMMPNLQLSDKEADDLTAFLATLKQ